MFFENEQKLAKHGTPPKKTFHILQNTGYKKKTYVATPSWPKIGVFTCIFKENIDVE